MPPGQVPQKVNEVNLVADALAKHRLDPHTLHPYSQGDNEACVAASLAYAVALACLASSPRARDIIYSHGQVPSVNYAYHRMRQLDRKCHCGRNREGVCDKFCGGFVTTGIGVFEVGVPPASFWPEDRPDDRALVARLKTQPFLGASYVFRLREFRTLSNTATEVLAALRAGHPVVINLKVFHKQKAFFERSGLNGGSGGELGGGSGLGIQGGSGVQDTVYAPRFQLPPPDNEGPTHHMGHCVLVIGYSDAAQAFRVRNSFGDQWGYHGDFSIPFRLFHEDQVYQSVAVVSGDVRELDR